jgi:aryl-alcohol dehydrogenase-like predicted oxidoreductase
METRELGETGQESTVLAFGAVLLRELEQVGANRAVELALDHGVNHFDVAPTYGDAELKLGPKLREHREEVFLGCKTRERSYEGAREKLRQSLNRLGVETIDLYQFHSVSSQDDLEEITGADGALRAFREAKEEGLIDHIGLTSHEQASLMHEAIDRIDDLATLMFPLNFTVMGTDVDATDYKGVLDRCEEDGIGTIGIKAFAKQPWQDDDTLPVVGRGAYGTWYEPYDTQTEVDDCLNFALSQGLTTITNAGDPKLLPMILDAADRFESLDSADQERLLEQGRARTSPVPRSRTD